MRKRKREKKTNFWRFLFQKYNVFFLCGCFYNAWTFWRLKKISATLIRLGSTSCNVWKPALFFPQKMLLTVNDRYYLGRFFIPIDSVNALCGSTNIWYCATKLCSPLLFFCGAFALSVFHVVFWNTPCTLLDSLSYLSSLFSVFHILHTNIYPLLFSLWCFT